MLGGNLEVLIDLISFRNIDLYEQGFYSLRVDITANNSEIVYPYLIVPTKYQTKLDSIVFDTSFYSKIFQITYSDQFVDLDNSCIFRICYNSYPNKNIQLTIRVSLLYSLDLQTQTDTETALAQMNQVSTYEFVLRNSCDAQQTGIEAIFDSLHFSSAKIYIYTITVDYKFNGQITFQEFLAKETQQFDQKLINEFIHNYIDSLYSIQLKYKNLLIQINNQLNQTERSLYFSQLMKIPMVQTERFKTNLNLDTVAEDALQMINSLGQSLFQLWCLFQQLLRQSKLYIVDLVEQKILLHQKQLAEYFVSTNILVENEFLSMPSQNIIKSREEQYQSLKKGTHGYFPTVQQQFYINFPQVPILFEDIQQISQQQQQQQQQQQKQQQQQQQQKLRHILILVHGYQGTSMDMQLWRNFLHQKFPHHIIIQSQSNEFDTEVDIQGMSKNLAMEIQKAIIEKLPAKQQKIKLSFIGHSLGGVLIRGALNHLQRYNEYMHTFISLGSPHAGLNVQQSAIIETGLWFMKAMKKKGDRTCLDQMTLSDSQDVKNSYIAQLSSKSSLGQFKNIILAYSMQDQYAPFTSASLTKLAQANSKREILHNEIVSNIINQIEASHLIKVSVQFPMLKQNLDKMIGRAAHIEFIDNPTFVNLFIDYYYEYLE